MTRLSEPSATRWWFLVPLLTFGLATPAVVLLGAARLRSVPHAVAGAGYLAALATMVTIAVTTDATTLDQGRGILLSVLYYGVWFGGTAHAVFLHSRIRDRFLRGTGAPHPAGPYPGGNPHGV